MSPGMAAAIEPGTAVAVFFILLVASFVIPLLVAWKWGGRIVAIVIAVWAAAWIAILTADPDGLSTWEAVGVALLVLTPLWVIGAGIGLAIRRWRKPQEQS
jgi:hypothetical protein